MLPVLRREVVIRGHRDRPTSRVLQRRLETVSSSEKLLEFQLEAFQTLPFAADSTEHVRGDRAHRVISLVQWREPDPRQLHLLDLRYRAIIEVIGDFDVAALVAIAEQLAQLERITIQQLGEPLDRLVHLGQAAAIRLKFILHELRIDEQRRRLHGSGHQHAVAVVNTAAARHERLALMLLPFRAADRLLAAVSL